MKNWRMDRLTLVARSLDALTSSWETTGIELADADVVVVPTAAAFAGPEAVLITVSDQLTARGARVEGLMVTDRSGANEPYFARRLEDADVVLVPDGAALHARTVWRGTAVGEALVNARRMAAVGAVASVLGSVMIDPRGGAPTTGLGRFDDLVVGTCENEVADRRTVGLLGAATVALMGDAGVVIRTDVGWRVLVGDVAVTRAGVVSAL